jgi:TPR repeat protein
MGAMTRRWKLGIGVCLVLCGAGAIAGRYIYRVIGHRRLVQAASLTRIQAEKGDARAQLELGSIFYYGRGVPEDYSAAARWYRSAAQQGDPTAENAIAFMYYYGEGVPRDYGEATRWYRKAADQGNARAAFYLGSMYYDGKGVPQDYIEAARWYRKAADQGDAKAQVNLGSMYHDGKGIAQDYDEAIRWYRKAAYQGSAEAEYSLGYMYYYGQGLPQDYADGVRWFRKAASHGYPDARLVLRTIEKKSVIATRIEYFEIFVAFAGGLVLFVGSLLGSRWSGKSLRSSRRAIALGVSALSYGGLSLYGVMHDMRYSPCRNLFYLAKGSLIGIVIILGIAIVATKPRKAP